MTDETTVTGKPLADYEQYVELLSHVMANGLALATEREFLADLDLSLPLHEALRPHVRSAIRLRFAHDIDEIEAAAPEPEWEYRYAEKLGDTEYTYGPEGDEHGWFSTVDEANAARIEDTDYVVRRRPAGPVEPLPVGGETDG